jgi:hypothetical protein
MTSGPLLTPIIKKERARIVEAPASLSAQVDLVRETERAAEIRIVCPCGRTHLVECLYEPAPREAPR